MERKLNKTEREVLRRLCEYKCEECREHEEECGTLQPHRIKRGNQGGRYTLRNIKMVCNRCHKMFHSKEDGIAR